MLATINPVSRLGQVGFSFVGPNSPPLIEPFLKALPPLCRTPPKSSRLAPLFVSEMHIAAEGWCRRQ